MTKILYLCSNRWNSAITEYCLNSAEALQKTSPVHLIALEQSPCYKRAMTLDLKEVYAFRSFTLREFKHFRKLLKDINPDLIFCFGGPEATLAKLVVKTLPNKVKLIKFRGQDLKTGFWPTLRTRLSDNGFASLVFPAKWLEEKYKALNPGSDNTKTILLGTDAKRFHFEKPVLEQRPFILFVGRFDPIKGFKELFALVAALHQSLPDEVKKPKLLILGREENLSTADLEDFAMVNQLTIGNDVEIRTNFQQDIHRLMSSAVCGFISSLGSEVICRVSQEFLCCGTPIVVSGVGSLEESLFDDRAGISYRGLRDAETVAQLSSFYRQALSESAEIKEQRSRRAIQCFGYERHRKELFELIDLAP